MQSIDIRKSADLLIEKHGANARQIAESMADARRASKDYEGCAMWLSVLETINSVSVTCVRRACSPVHSSTRATTIAGTAAPSASSAA